MLVSQNRFFNKNKVKKQEGKQKYGKYFVPLHALIKNKVRESK